MEQMTDQGHLESAAYMIRNLSTGDDEQTRIEDQWALDELPDTLANACKYLCNTGRDYDGACLIYIRWHLYQTVRYWWDWEKKGHKTNFITACNTVHESLWNWEDLTDEEKKDANEFREDDIRIWTEAAEAILKGGC